MTEQETEDLVAKDQDVTEGESKEEPTVENPQPKTWSEEDEAEARTFGWKPPDEWRGDKPDSYLDNPGDYLERVQGSRIFQAMQARMTEQARKLDAVHEATQARIRADYEGKMAAIASQQRRAVEDADTESWDKLEEQRQELMQSAPQAAPQGGGMPPELLEYERSEEGRWLANPMLGAEAAQFIEDHPAYKGLPPMTQAALARDHLSKKYPALFPGQEQPKPTVTTKVDPGGLDGGTKRDRSEYSKLPKEAKAQFEKDVKRGTFKDTKEQREWFADVYNNG